MICSDGTQNVRSTEAVYARQPVVELKMKDKAVAVTVYNSLEKRPPLSVITYN